VGTVVARVIILRVVLFLKTQIERDRTQGKKRAITLLQI
jgi:hypothetical protein